MHRPVNRMVWGSNLCRVISVYVSEALKISAAWEVNISTVFPNITDDGDDDELGRIDNDDD